MGVDEQIQVNRKYRLGDRKSKDIREVLTGGNSGMNLHQKVQTAYVSEASSNEGKNALVAKRSSWRTCSKLNPLCVCIFYILGT